MPSHINVNFDYDKQELLDMFNSSEKVPEGIAASKAVLPAGVVTSSTFKHFLSEFPFVLENDDSVTIFQLNRFQRPHVNPGNNGLIIFPVSGDIVLKTYAYSPNIDEVTGRKVINTASMTVEQEAIIEATLAETFIITRPILVDGLTTYALGPHNGTAIMMALKVPMSMTWEEVRKYVEETFREPLPVTAPSVLSI